jgi:hypothetical protein
MDPLKFMVALIDRWALSSFFTFSILEGTIWVEEDCEPRQMVGLMEDLVALIIYLAMHRSGNFLMSSAYDNLPKDRCWIRCLRVICSRDQLLTPAVSVTR